jgi:hypothetical protein
MMHRFFNRLKMNRLQMDIVLMAVDSCWLPGAYQLISHPKYQLMSLHYTLKLST